MFSKKNKFISFVASLFLVYFFSNNLIYAQTHKKSDVDYLIPMGNILQIDAELKHLIVRNTCENSPFLIGDSIIEINNTPIESYSDFSKTLYDLTDVNNVSVLVKRGTNEFKVFTKKEILESLNFNNLISGFATLTYINPDTNEFGAVGHPINIGSSKKIPIKNGSISSTSTLNIEKSSRGNVGSINAIKKDVIGKIEKNTSFGIKGTISNLDTSSLKKYKVASLNEVKVGKAQILLQTSSGGCNTYDIEILSIEKQKHPDSKTFKIRVLDPRLLNITGGIVQGMSGTPIIQDDKIVGAVSHAVENDPSLGYAVFIQWMIDEK